jgi:hypothetical protein
MKVENLKDLSKIIQTCRKLGVESIKVGDLEFHLGQVPGKRSARTSAINQEIFPEELVKVPKYNGLPGLIKPEDVAREEHIDTPDELTEEQRMFYSSEPQEQQG